MKKSKGIRITVACLTAVLCMMTALTGCGEDGEERDPTLGTLSAPIKIAALKGPTGMGLAYLMEQTEDYEVSLYQSPDESVAKVLSGDVDIAAVPSNLGAVLYNKNKGDLCVLAVNTGGISYMVENGPKTIGTMADLKGKTILASGKGSTPEYMLHRLLLNAGLNPSTDVTIQWVGNHSDAAAAFLAEPGSIAMLPEPFVSVACAQNPKATVSVDLNEQWESAYEEEVPMGIFLAKKSFVQDRQQDLTIFMRDCEESADRVDDNPVEASELIAKAGIVNSASVAQKAIPRCNIMFESGKDSKEMLVTLYQILLEMEPASVGGALPADDFYYMAPDKED